MKKLLIILLFVSLALCLAACGDKPANNAPAVPAMTYAEYAAASENAKVVIEGYVQAYAYNAAFNSVNMFLQDDDGAYYVYRAVCDAEKAGSLAVGKLVRVSGIKGSYAGEIEIQEQSTFEILAESKVYDPVDVTALYGDEKALEARMNQKISLKGLSVSESYDKSSKVSAFLYNWDGSGQQGVNDDVYFSASSETGSSLLVIESDENPEGSPVYSAATGFAVGDLIDIEGYMYWYNGPNIHVSSIKVTKHSKADLEKSGGSLTHAQYMMTGDGEPAVIEAYVQGLPHCDAQTGSFSVLLSDADGAYYAKGMLADTSVFEKIGYGSKLRISGYRSTENGMPMMTGASTVVLLDGYYIAPASIITSVLDDTDALADLSGQKAVVKGMTFAAADMENGIIQTVGANGKVYSFVTAPEDRDKGSDLYRTIENIDPGSVIDLTCFVFLDPQPQLQVQSIAVK